MFCERHKHRTKGFLMTFFHWLLLALAIADVLMAVVQLTLLSAMRLIVYDMKPPVAWLVTVGPSVAVLVLSIWSLRTPLDSYPHWGVALLIVAYLAFMVVLVFQVAAAMPILDKRREWDEQNTARDRAMGQH